jgi:hypothetical protein
MRGPGSKPGPSRSVTGRNRGSAGPALEQSSRRSGRDTRARGPDLPIHSRRVAHSRNHLRNHHSTFQRDADVGGPRRGLLAVPRRRHVSSWHTWPRWATRNSVSSAELPRAHHDRPPGRDCVPAVRPVPRCGTPAQDGWCDLMDEVGLGCRARHSDICERCHGSTPCRRKGNRRSA